MQGQQRNAWICTQSKKASDGRRGFDEPWADELKKFRMQHADATDDIDAIVGRSLLNLALYLSVLPSDKSYHQIVGKKAEKFSAQNRRAGFDGRKSELNSEYRHRDINDALEAIRLQK
jgi:hypothetical protein